jgi:uncharacterized OsmC-like protein
MTAISVQHLGGHSFEVDVRGHKVVVDQPVEAGGHDAGMNPTELFVAGLAACVAHYAHGYLARHGIDPTGLTVDADFAFATDRPARVARIEVRVQPPAALPERSREAFLAVASHCTVHNTLEVAPEVSVTLLAGEPDVAA